MISKLTGNYLKTKDKAEERLDILRMWPCTYISAGQGKQRCIGVFLTLSVGEGVKRNEVQGKRNEVQDKQHVACDPDMSAS